MVKYLSLLFAALAFPAFTATAQYIDPEAEDVDSVAVEVVEELPTVVEEPKSEINYDQLEKRWKRRKFWNFGYSVPTLERTDGTFMDWEPDFAVSVQNGRTAFFHKKPLGGMVKIGLDYSFLDITYSKLNLKHIESAEVGDNTSIPSDPSVSDGFDEIVSDDPSGSILSAVGFNIGMHKIDETLSVGPRIAINPVDHLMIGAYFHGGFTMSGIYENENFSYGFGYTLSTGLCVSYKVIGFGFEYLCGKVKYKQIDFDEMDLDELSFSEMFSSESFRLKHKGPRVYVSFRF
ncbi:MAG: hypothetical protein ACI36Z_09305 [Alloprevotella sp.]